MASKNRLAAAQGPIERERPAPKSVTYTAKDVPSDATAEQIMDWVSGDARRAQAALSVEQKASTPRTSLVSSLQRLVAGNTGAGVATGEA